MSMAAPGEVSMDITATAPHPSEALKLLSRTWQRPTWSNAPSQLIGQRQISTGRWTGKKQII